MESVIRMARDAFPKEWFRKWASDWLCGLDRSQASALRIAQAAAWEAEPAHGAKSDAASAMCANAAAMAVWATYEPARKQWIENARRWYRLAGVHETHDEYGGTTGVSLPGYLR